jgi:hypothetical protein
MKTKVTKKTAHVYVVRNDEQEPYHPELKGAVIRVTDVDGNKLGAGYILSAWPIGNGTRMVSVRFVIDHIPYAGKFNIDRTEICKAKAMNPLFFLESESRNA